MAKERGSFGEGGRGGGVKCTKSKCCWHALSWRAIYDAHVLLSVSVSVSVLVSPVLSGSPTAPNPNPNPNPNPIVTNRAVGPGWIADVPAGAGGS